MRRERSNATSCRLDLVRHQWIRIALNNCRLPDFPIESLAVPLVRVGIFRLKELPVFKSF